jgi:predicted nucleotidyltransferase
MVDHSQALEIPALDQRQHVPMYAIQAVVDVIAAQFEPDQIVLFGSHAYGSPQPWSDVDLLVIMESDRHPVEVSQEILQALPPFLFSVEILVRSAETIRRRIKLGDPFLKEITARGKVLYARADR